ncbi:MAG: sigma-70 family RNA polymerase sigma factor [Gemmataceae bacterium]
MNRRWLIALSQSLGHQPSSGLMRDSDFDLLKRFRDGHDQDAFAELVRRNGPMVWAVCRQLLPNPSDAEDAVQATFLALIQSAARIRKQTNPGAWLYGVAVRIAAKIQRSAVRRRQREERVARSERVTAPASKDWSDLYRFVHEEIVKLPLAMRSAFILCEVQNVPVNEAALQLGCSANALSARLSKARRKLMTVLTKRGITPAVVMGLIGVGSVASSAGMPASLVTTLQTLPTTELATLPVHIVKLFTEVSAMSTIRTKIVATAMLTLSGLAFSFGVATFANPMANGTSDTPAAAKSSAKNASRTAEVKAETSVKGKVLLPDGKPAAGAIVWAAKRTYSPLERKETVADQSGQYELKLDKGDWFLFARRGTMGSVANNPGGMQELELDGQKKDEDVNFSLEERGLLKGRLVAKETQQPIANAQLYLDCGVVLTTDAKGKFEIGGLSRTHHEMFVVAPGRLRHRYLYDTTANAVTELEISAAKGAKIIGTVTDAAGNPIPGASIGYSTSGSIFSTNALYQACRNDGTFEYDGVTLDRKIELTAAAPGYEEMDREVTVTSLENPTRIEFKLNPVRKLNDSPQAGQAKMRVVSGVVRSPDGKPLRDARVRWGYMPYVGATETRTDANGFYKLTVPEESSLLAILTKTYAPLFPRVDAKGDAQLDVTLKEGETAFGTVYDDDGKPIPGVQVVAVTGSPDPSIGNPFWCTDAACITNAQGKFELKGIPPKAKFDFMKAGLTDRRNLDLNTNGVENPITMQYGGAIKGKVVDLNGKPIRNFRVTVNFPQDPKAGDHTEGYFAGYSGVGVQFSSEDGSFVLTGVGADSVYRIQALAEGHGEAVIDRVTAVPVNHLEKTPATVIKAEAPASLKIKVINTAGESIANASVILINADKSLDHGFVWGYHEVSWYDSQRKRADAKGVAEFNQLSFSQGTIVIQAPGMARLHTGWRNRDKQREIVMDPESVLNGAVKFPKDRFEQGFSVHLMSQTPGHLDQLSHTVSHKDDGKFKITGLTAGKWTVTLRDNGPSGKTVNAIIELKAGETKDWHYEWTVEK